MKLFYLSFIFVMASVGVSADEGEKAPLRIVALAPHVVESLFAIGAGNSIIATSEHSDYPEAAKQIPRVGNYARLQIERIVQLSPDIIIAWRTGNPQDDLARLKKYGLTVVYSNPTTLESVADELIMLGKLVNKQETAQRLANQYLQRLNTLKLEYASAPPVTGFYELWARPLRTVANKAWLQQQLEVCGVNNPFSHLHEDYPLVSLEQVLAINPQIVIQPTPHSAKNADALDWSVYPHILASKNDLIFHPNADKTHRMTVRMLEEVERLCAFVDKARQRYNTK